MEVEVKGSFFMPEQTVAHVIQKLCELPPAAEVKEVAVGHEWMSVTWKEER